MGCRGISGILCISALALIVLGCGSSSSKNIPIYYTNPWVIVDFPGEACTEDVEIFYRLMDDGNSICSIAVSYSIDGGATYRPATTKSGDGLTGLTSSFYPGVLHLIVWDTMADGIGCESCIVKIEPFGPENNPGASACTQPFTVENGGVPRLGWVARAEGDVPFENLTFYWENLTPEVSITHCYYQIDNYAQVDVGAVTDATLYCSSYALGMHTMNVWAVSSMGRESQRIQTVFTYTSEVIYLAPVIRINSGPTGIINSSTATFEYEAHDLDGTILRYYVSVDENPPTGQTTNRSWTTPALANGIHTFYVLAEDNEGRYSAVLSRQFEVTGQ